VENAEACKQNVLPRNERNRIESFFIAYVGKLPARVVCLLEPLPSFGPLTASFKTQKEVIGLGVQVRVLAYFSVAQSLPQTDLFAFKKECHRILRHAQQIGQVFLQIFDLAVGITPQDSGKPLFLAHDHAHTNLNLTQQFFSALPQLHIDLLVLPLIVSDSDLHVLICGLRFNQAISVHFNKEYIRPICERTLHSHLFRGLELCELPHFFALVCLLASLPEFIFFYFFSEVGDWQEAVMGGLLPNENWLERVIRIHFVIN
jgi:hypothetical protein